LIRCGAHFTAGIKHVDSRDIARKARPVPPQRCSAGAVAPPAFRNHGASASFTITGRGLLRGNFRVAIYAQSDLGPFVCAFREFEGSAEIRRGSFVTWCAMRGRVFFYTQTGRQTMQKGTVKWFNPTKGYGFIKPTTGDKDVFVHISAVERAGLSTLNEDQVIEFDLVENRGKASAENLKVS
jgi:CspA family cold shock protein